MIPFGLLLNRYTAVAALVAAAGVAGWAYRAHLVSSGYEQAVSDTRAQQAERLREQAREMTRLVGTVKGLNDELNKERMAAEVFAARQRAAADQWVREQADFERRAAAASADSLRRYAQATDGNLERCRADVARFAGEAAAASATAHALKKNLEALATQ